MFGRFSTWYVQNTWVGSASCCGQRFGAWFGVCVDIDFSALWVGLGLILC